MNHLFNFSQKQLLEFTKKLLAKKGYKTIVTTPDYVFAVGDIPVAVTAHLDTVHLETANKKEIFCDSEQGVIWCPTGLGADDRAGVYAIIRLLNKGYRPSVLFLTDEEIGSVGAGKLINDFPKCPIKDLKYIIELDRRNAIDCVFYDCDNQKFTDYIESFGFAEAWGTFSDICEICPAWGVAGVNLSVGYENEHTKAEFLRIAWLNSTIDKVIKMFKDIDKAPTFEYVHRPHYTWHKAWGTEGDCYVSSKTGVTYACKKCHRTFNESDVVRVRQSDGSYSYYCIDCLDGGIEFCDFCEDLYATDMNNPMSPRGICPTCYNKLKEGALKVDSKRNSKTV